MKRRHRIYFTETQKSEIWDRWERGESMSSIGRLFDRNSSSIFPLLSRTGGIRPPARTRSRLALSLPEREEISRGRPSPQASPFNDQPGGGAQWWLCGLSGVGIRSSRMGSCPSPEALQAGLQPSPEPHSIAETATQMVT